MPLSSDLAGDHALKSALSETVDGIVLRIRLTPRAARDEVAGVRVLSDGRQVIAVRVRAVPEDGAANAALEKLMARALSVPAGRVRVAAGRKDRLKTVHVDGDRRALAARARALIEVDGG